jgi:homoserine dehydrogenase
MNIALIGNGNVSQALVPIILNKNNKLFLFKRGNGFFEDQVFDKVYNDFFSVSSLKNIDVVIDMLGTNDEAIQISRKIIKDSLSNNKYVITCNKKLMSRYGAELCDHAKNTNGHLYINSLVASSVYYKKYPVYLSIDNFKEISKNKDIFFYRGAGPHETALSIYDEIIRIGKIHNE